ncbi:phosphatase PAP2 family protein [Klebsiella sp. BIGb0407]|uniref:phosphatase PAP2 family protein n=1 Tax=Klebsiella sp. BIGb0407 TaxID=2940603 RepID=UPI002168ED2A|nr:phosphatase PAP2 family protein [Klebsiella sp. BIGb0407]MCS3430705.1 membrane-associated phospholipid phosphatase [Klebsiella sp. BIGb0407]
MKNGFYRAGQLLLGWGFVGVIYHLTDNLQSAGQVITPSWIDNKIPFSASAIWAYLSFFLIIPAGYFLAPLTAVRWLTRSMQLTALGAGLIYLLWPTTLVTPPDSGQGIESVLLKQLISVDSAQNCFPSLHVALTLLAVWAIARSRKHFLTLAFILWGGVIAFSILQLKRHLFIDLIGGVVLASGAGMLVSWVMNRQKEKPGE